MVRSYLLRVYGIVAGLAGHAGNFREKTNRQMYDLPTGKFYSFKRTSSKSLASEISSMKTILTPLEPRVPAGALNHVCFPFHARK